MISVSICIIYGKQKRYVELSTFPVTMDDIHPHVRDVIGNGSSKAYYIKTYHSETKDFISLNQNELDYGYNPFQFESAGDNDGSDHMFEFVDLYIVEGVSTEEVTLDSHDYLSSLMADEQEEQHDISIEGDPTNENILDSNNLTNLLLDNEPTEMTVDQSSNDDTATNTQPLASIPILNVIHVNKNLLIPNAPSNLTPAEEVQRTQSARLGFSLDVKSVQKEIYKSDRFNQKSKNKRNGYITRIQGIKTERAAKSSVLPRIRIPRQYRGKASYSLDTYIVSERSRHGRRFWIKHRDKGFLPKGYTSTTIPVNPISFPLDEMALTDEGDFKLCLPMTTMWNKSGSGEEEVHHLDERTAAGLHRAPYEPTSPRLLCVLRQNSEPLWKTACLSDYIRSPKKRKRALSSASTEG